MSSTHDIDDILTQAFELYLHEFGSNYNERTFVDYVVRFLNLAPRGAPDMVQFYRRKAKEFERRPSRRPSE